MTTTEPSGVANIAQLIQLALGPVFLISGVGVTLNVPFKQVGAAHLTTRRNGTGTITLETLGETRISYLVCWPHVRPWHFAKTQPALRCIPDAARVAKLLADAAETRLSEPIVARAASGMALAAE